MKKVFFVLFFLIPVSLFADQITIYNKGDQDLFVAIYYYKNRVERVGEVRAVTRKQVLVIERPDRIFSTDRELALSPQKNLLKKVFSKDQFRLIKHRNIGTLKGKYFYITEKDYQLKAYTETEWKVLQPILEKTKKIIKIGPDAIKNEIKKKRTAVRENPYQEKPAIVRMGNNLSEDEKKYLHVRKPKVKKALERILRRPIADNEVPTIAFIGSGGGCRAMISTLGFLIGAKEIGLLDATTYITALSGSTWMLGLWMTSNLPIGKFKRQLIPKMSNGIELVSTEEMGLILSNFLVKFAFDQSITLVDFYGALLANTFLRDFGNRRQRIYLSDQRKRVRIADVPFPIYTAVSGEGSLKHSWYEFTPFEVGNIWLKSYVPTWAFGRKFNKGVSVDFAPEQSLGFYLGTFGSAFSANVDTMYKESFLLGIEPIYRKIESNVPFGIVKKIASEPLRKLGKQRVTWAEVFNYTAGMQTSPISIKKQLKLVDAGLDLNLPYSPVSGQRPERKADILIFLDASKTIEGSTELKKVEAYARKHGLPFPKINYSGIDQRAITVIKDEHDPKKPVIIYMPLIKDKELWAANKESGPFRKYKRHLELFDPVTCIKESFCDTFNFKYSREEAQQLSLLTEFNMKASRQKIVDALNWVIDKKISKK